MALPLSIGHLRLGVFVQKCHLSRLGRRTYLTSGVHLKSIDNIVRKFLINNNDTKKKRRWYETKMLQNPNALSQPQMKGEKNSHRLHTLNKVFMGKICEILSSGRLSALFTGYGLEISRVQVTAGMTSINVHWYCTGSDVDGTITRLLEGNANHIRFELSKQNVIGRVPPILFIKDHRYYKLMEIERLLAVADFGEDFVPSDPTFYAKADFVLREEFDDRIKNALNIAEESNEDFFQEALKLSASVLHEAEEIEVPSDIPIMRDNVLGVDTKKIYFLVRQGMTRARAEHRKNAEYQSLLEIPINPEHCVPSRTEEIRQWVTKYHQLRKEKRSKNKDDAHFSLPQDLDEYSHDEELSWKEEDDYMDENFDESVDQSGLFVK